MAKKKYIWVGKVNPKVKGCDTLKWRRSKHLRTEFQSYLDILLLSSVSLQTIMVTFLHKNLAVFWKLLRLHQG